MAAPSSTAPSTRSFESERHSQRPQRTTAQASQANAASPITPFSAASFTMMLCASFAEHVP